VQKILIDRGKSVLENLIEIAENSCKYPGSVADEAYLCQKDDQAAFSSDFQTFTAAAHSSICSGERRASPTSARDAKATFQLASDFAPCATQFSTSASVTA
jgi:hypothetical protein